MTRLRLMASAIALTLCIAPAFAQKLTYADDRCKDSAAHNIICMGMIEPTSLEEIFGYAHFSDFREFIEANASLSEGVNPETEVPAYRVFVVGKR